MNNKIKNCLFVLSCFFSCMYSLSSETIRDRANIHFNLINWIVKEDSIPFVEISAQSLPGGNEVFPVISSTAQNMAKTIYPEVERLGIIDYSGINKKLLSLFTSTAAGLKERKIENDICNDNRPFIAVLSTYQLQKLPVPSSVLFSRPVKNANKGYDSIFRMQFINENSSSYVFLFIKAELIDDAWKIHEILFDGETYASLAQSD